MLLPCNCIEMRIEALESAYLLIKERQNIASFRRQLYSTKEINDIILHFIKIIFISLR